MVHGPVEKANKTVSFKHEKKNHGENDICKKLSLFIEPAGDLSEW